MQLIEDSLDLFSLELTLINVSQEIKRSLRFLAETVLEDDMETILNWTMMDLSIQVRMSLEMTLLLGRQQDQQDLGKHKILVSSRMFQHL